MKKSILIVAGVAIMIAGVYYNNQHLTAQPPAGGGAAPAQPGTRVAVVNIGLVFNKYVRAQAFKKELEDSVSPFKAKGKKLSDDMKDWYEASLKPGIDPKLKDQYEAGVRNNKRQLEDMQLEISKLIGKKQEDNLVTLWKEVKQGIEAVGKAYGFQVVLGYGDPMEKEVLDLFPNVNRKMTAMDQGSIVPLYIHGSVDLSQAVADTLNSWVPGNKSVPAQPTSGGGTK